MRFLSLLLPLLACAAFGCASDAPEIQVSNFIPRPADQASEEEAAQLEATISKIEKISAELGHPRQYRQVPLIVIADDDTTVTQNPAACVRQGTSPQFIVVKHKVLGVDRALGPEALESSLFRVVLHEIGHCYFGREHDDSRIQDGKRAIGLTLKHRSSAVEVRYPMLDVSIMASDSLTVPVDLERYYVAELLGLVRAKSIDDFSAYAPVRLIPNPESTSSSL